MRARTLIWIVLLSAPLCTAAWVRIASPGLEVFTDAGEKSGRQLMARFQDIRAILEEPDRARHLPVRVFAFSSQNEFNAYHDTAAGFYRNGFERDYIALRVGPDIDRVVFHEYVHLVLNQALRPLPQWFEEGLADFYSTIEMKADRLRVGRPIDSHVRVLASAPWLTAAQLAEVTATSRFYTERDRASIFYAESWALVHMLNLSPDWRGGMPQFVLRMSEGDPPEEAFQSAFGRNMNGAVSDLRSYLRSVPSVTVGASPRVVSPGEIRAGVVTAVESTLALADLALHIDRPQQARRLTERLTREHPDSPEVAAAAGALARAESRNDDARKLLARAIELGSRDAATFFEYAMAEEEVASQASTKGPRVEQLLGKVVELNPEFADAQFLLGVRQTDDGRYENAIEHLRIATQLRPRRSDYWHALGYAESKAGRSGDGLASARRAAATASTAAEEGMAQGLMALAQEHPGLASPKSADVITPRSWTNRKGDARIEGVLIRFDCEDHPAKMLLRSAAGAEIVLNVLHPKEIELVNAPSTGYQFFCGSQQTPLIVEYFSGLRDVTRIEFRP